MPQQTDYNQFDHPVPNSESTEDKDEWAPVLDALFEDQVDETIIKRGALSDRPPTGSSKDVAKFPRLYLATDQTPPLLSFDNDTEWVDVNPFSLYAALGQNETVSGTWTYDNEIDGAARRAAKTFGPIVNGGHSDFATAQDAIDFADTNGKVVEMPPGTYGTITVPNGLIVRGNGVGDDSTKFEASVTGGGVVSLGANTVLEHCDVSNTGTGSGDHGIVTTNTRSTVRNVRFSQAGGDGYNSNDVNEGLVTACDTLTSNIGGSSVLLTANTTRCIVSNNRKMGTITDNGSGNVVANNT